MATRRTEGAVIRLDDHRLPSERPSLTGSSNAVLGYIAALHQLRLKEAAELFAERIRQGRTDLDSIRDPELLACILLLLTPPAR